MASADRATRTEAAARELLRVLEVDGGFNAKAEAEIERCSDPDGIGEPWTAMRALRAALEATQGEPKTTEWACPKCNAQPQKHGNGPCQYYEDAKACEGFLCECDFDDDAPEHGTSQDHPCQNANCYHCNWGGTFPPPPFNPKKLPKWAKTAFEAGWRPPDGWQP